MLPNLFLVCDSNTGSFQPDGHRADHGFTDIVAVELWPLQYSLPTAFSKPPLRGKRSNRVPHIAGVLAVYEGIKRLAEARELLWVKQNSSVLKATVMQGRIHRFTAVGREVFHHEVHQAVAGLEGFGLRAFDVQPRAFQPGVKIAVMSQAALDVFEFELAVLENFLVRLELDEGAVGFLRLAGVFLFQFADLEAGLRRNSPSRWLRTKKFFDRALTALCSTRRWRPTLNWKTSSLYSFAGIDLGNAVHDLAEGDAAAEIAYGHAVAIEADLDFRAVAHDEFINGIVHDFLEQDVTTGVVRVDAGADAPDIHAGAQPDVLQLRTGS